MIVAGYYTVGTPYEQEAAALRETLDRFGLAHDIRVMSHPGSWIAACLLKAEAIQSVRADHLGEAVLYLDADARVLQPPVIFAEYEAAGFDLGIYRAPWTSELTDPPGDREIVASVIWFGATVAAGDFLDAWAALNRLPESRRCCDQINLAWVVKCVERKEGVKIAWLPDAYCWIDGISPARVPQPHPQPIIYQTQASRRNYKL